MKRYLMMLFTFCCLMGFLVIPAFAESAATRVDYYATANVDGDCLVTMTVNLHLEDTGTGLTFPVPAGASNVTLNGSNAQTSKTASAVYISLDKVTGGVRGDFPLQIAFTLPDVVTVVQGDSVLDTPQLKLELPILCGFRYPVQSLNYTITLPKDNTAIPDFSSTYRQNGVVSDLNCIANGSMITGSSKTAFNDHEALSMSMIVPRDMFPGVNVNLRTGNPELVPMGIFAGLALLYWLLFLRTLPPGKERVTTPPSGISAGELGCRLTLTGGDLTMMVFSWAQMGYLLIHVDNNGRVLLHKRMEMGNERNLFEVRAFQALFGQRRVVDATGIPYAKNCRRTAAMVPGEKTMCKSASGNTRIFRGLCCAAQVFCGICVAMNMTSLTVLQVLLSLVFGAFGVFSAWQIHEIAYRMFLRNKTRSLVGWACCVIWILLGLLCGQVWIPMGAAAVQILMGFLAAYGGRRTELNRLEMSQILSLRRYLRKMPREDVPRMLQSDPDYFFRLAPYAMAMGVLKPFALAFGKRKLEQCPYLVSQVHGRRKAEDWAMLMVSTADQMDARFRRMELERWIPVKIR